MNLDEECRLQLEVQGLREVLKRKEKDLNSLREYNEIERLAFKEQISELERIKQEKEDLEKKMNELLTLEDNINEKKRIQIESLQYKSGYELLKEVYLQNLKVNDNKKLREESERIVAIVDM